MIVIPAFEPDGVLLILVKSLREQTEQAVNVPLVIVDDGSRSDESAKVFAECETLPHVTVLRHPHNCGKGAALKTGLKYAQDHNAMFLCTADADGQHSLEDINKLVSEAQTTTGFLLGVRSFDKNVPFRSQIGNMITRFVFYLLTRKWIADTQSGLRVIPQSLFNDFRNIRSDRYDFELVCLLKAARTARVTQIPIATIYEAGNPSSHFKPFMDSTLIYFAFLRFAFVAPLIALLDFTIFLSLGLLFAPSIAFLMTRCFTAVLYFIFMKEVVFKTDTPEPRHIIRFILLNLANMLIGSFLLGRFSTGTVDHNAMTYLIIMTGLAIVNFYIMRIFVFVKTTNIET